MAIHPKQATRWNRALNSAKASFPTWVCRMVASVGADIVMDGSMAEQWKATAHWHAQKT